MLRYCSTYFRSFRLFLSPGMSQQGQLYNPVHFATELPDNTPIAFVIGAFAVGSINPIDHPYVWNIHLIDIIPNSFSDDRYNFHFSISIKWCCRN